MNPKCPCETDQNKDNCRTCWLARRGHTEECRCDNVVIPWMLADARDNLAHWEDVVEEIREIERGEKNHE